MFQLPANRGNTCFIDSVLAALFYKPLSYIECAISVPPDEKGYAFTGPFAKPLTQQQERKMKDKLLTLLSEVAKAIQDPRFEYLQDVCTELDYALKVYQPISLGEIEHAGTFKMNGALDFAGFLFGDIFNLEAHPILMIKQKESFYFEDQLVRSNTRRQRPFLRFQPPTRACMLRDLLSDSDVVELTLTDQERHTLRYPHKKAQVYKHSVILDANFLVVGFDRLTHNGHGQPTLNTTHVIPDAILHINRKDLLLYALVIYRNSHYFTYFVVEDTWYCYDDLQEIQELGFYEKMAILPELCGMVLAFYAMDG